MNWKSLTVTFILWAFVLVAHVASAQVPICRLGGPTAMDTRRQLGDGETFVITDRPLVVNLRSKPTAEHPEQVGECMLPKGTKVAQKNGILQWVAECGNDEVNKNIPVAPILTLWGPRGLQGVSGRDGKDGRDGIDGKDGANGLPGRMVFATHHSWCGTKCKVFIALGGAAAGWATYYYWPCPPGTTKR